MVAPTHHIDRHQALLRETERAHRAYEATELHGVYDQVWADWYAGYAVDQGIAELLRRPVNATELALLLTASWDEDPRSDPKPSESWAANMARRIAEVF